MLLLYENLRQLGGVPGIASQFVDSKPRTRKARSKGRIVARLDAMMATPGSTRVHIIASVPVSAIYELSESYKCC